MERKRVIILGASSGIGHEVARLFIEQGWTVGVAARRLDKLSDLKDNASERVFTARIDVTDEDAEVALFQLIKRMGGLDLYFHSSGIGWKNPTLEAEKEIKTMETNATGFTRMVGAAYRYFAAKGGGHIVCITSIAGTKGLGSAPAYSATKAMQNTYLQALEQLAVRKRHNIIFTDIRPGFVDTPLLTDSEHFPMLMTTEQVARSIMKAIRQRRHVCIIDTHWRILTFFWRLIPNWLWRRMKLS
ncbi:SDR family NAD(P)-dependent oxidoreductase [uncultured Alloprevotella sp.]|jgi:Short-chain dehydrogenases of various substrate specificities|uniref:SDR family NAD(P)-dependent oxidoreductase n=1 Tax=uncultured Alloprevotella sp. TaxID=1283315 RepID=UPI00263969D3|nr:SDR family NAD(P)-dependent oxidoreductase [uncultured Alloprevotella sp.]